jgi:nucleotide-binding universal stress UspA family protein
MSQKVLIGYDGSAEGEDALRLGRRLSELLGARPLVATVISHPREKIDPDEFDKAVAEFCAPLFAKARERLDGLDLLEQSTVNDSPAAGIYELTDWQKPNAIVIGSSRHGSTGRVQVGTVGGSLLSGAHSTVAVAPRGYAENHGSRGGRIGVAVDGSSESWRAVTAASLLAKRAMEPLRVISVMSEPHYVLGGLLSSLGPDEYRDFKEREWERTYEAAAARVRDGISTEPQLLRGEPAEALTEAAEELDLLVLGSRGYGPVKGTLLGSVSSRVMAAAPCPVLVVPRGAGPTPLQA